jgi:hypothetical protein
MATGIYICSLCFFCAAIVELSTSHIACKNLKNYFFSVKQCLLIPDVEVREEPLKIKHHRARHGRIVL